MLVLYGFQNIYVGLETFNCWEQSQHDYDIIFLNSNLNFSGTSLITIVVNTFNQNWSFLLSKPFNSKWSSTAFLYKSRLRLNPTNRTALSVSNLKNISRSGPARSRWLQWRVSHPLKRSWPEQSRCDSPSRVAFRGSNTRVRVST